MERLSPLKKGRRITGRERETLAGRLREAYAQGASIRQLTEQTGRSYGWTHRLLTEAGVQLRGRGGARPRRQARPAQAAAGPVTTAAMDRPPAVT